MDVSMEHWLNDADGVKLKYSNTLLARPLVIQFGPSGKFVENSTKLTCL